MRGQPRLRLLDLRHHAAFATVAEERDQIAIPLAVQAFRQHLTRQRAFSRLHQHARRLGGDCRRAPHLGRHLFPHSAQCLCVPGACAQFFQPGMLAHLLRHGAMDGVALLQLACQLQHRVPVVRLLLRLQLQRHRAQMFAHPALFQRLQRGQRGLRLMPFEFEFRLRQQAHGVLARRSASGLGQIGIALPEFTQRMRRTRRQHCIERGLFSQRDGALGRLFRRREAPFEIRGQGCQHGGMTFALRTLGAKAAHVGGQTQRMSETAQQQMTEDECGQCRQRKQRERYFDAPGWINQQDMAGMAGSNRQCNGCREQQQQPDEELHRALRSGAARRLRAAFRVALISGNSTARFAAASLRRSCWATRVSFAAGSK